MYSDPTMLSPLSLAAALKEGLKWYNPMATGDNEIASKC